MGKEVPKYKRKPTVVDAIKWRGDNFGALSSFLNNQYKITALGEGKVEIRNSFQEEIIPEGKYIIKGISGGLFF